MKGFREHFKNFDCNKKTKTSWVQIFKQLPEHPLSTEVSFCQKLSLFLKFLYWLVWLWDIWLVKMCALTISVFWQSNLFVFGKTFFYLSKPCVTIGLIQSFFVFILTKSQNNMGRWRIPQLFVIKDFGNLFSFKRF